MVAPPHTSRQRASHKTLRGATDSCTAPTLSKTRHNTSQRDPKFICAARIERARTKHHGCAVTNLTALSRILTPRSSIVTARAPIKTPRGCDENGADAKHSRRDLTFTCTDPIERVRPKHCGCAATNIAAHAQHHTPRGCNDTAEEPFASFGVNDQCGSQPCKEKTS